MNKTISVTIAGLVFNIEEEAYKILQDYLDSIKTYFSVQSYGAEVYADIEARVAEQFNKIIQETKLQVITMMDVTALKKTMGTVTDFTQDSKKDSNEVITEKKLFRNTDEAMLGGVASGIAAFFGWDTTLIRILFALTVFMGGWGIILYLILWLVTPAAETSAQKLAMHGHPITLKKLEQTVKQRLDEGSDVAKKSGSAIGRGGYKYAYAPEIKFGGRVFAGQLIGWMGDSGNAEGTGSHLHFEIRKNGRPFSPYHSLQKAKKNFLPNPIQRFA